MVISWGNGGIDRVAFWSAKAVLYLAQVNPRSLSFGPSQDRLRTLSGSTAGLASPLSNTSYCLTGVGFRWVIHAADTRRCVDLQDTMEVCDHVVSAMLHAQELPPPLPVVDLGCIVPGVVLILLWLILLWIRTETRTR